MANDDSREGRSYLTGPILDWLADRHAPHDEALQRAYDASAANGFRPIQLEPSEGRLLSLLMRMIGARRVVEIGTLAGYSAIWLARGLAPGGRLWTIERDERAAAIARENLVAAGVADHVEVRQGDAAAALAELAAEGPFDAVFVDADKLSYPAYGDWAAEQLRPGGLLIADNTLVFGELLDEDDERAAAMRRFHEDAAARFESVNVPTPDGLLLGLRR